MIIPRVWKLKRPGWLIPVFFLCLPRASGQIEGTDCSVIALGGTCVTRQGNSMAMYNQAGLGEVTGRSLSIQHARPFLAGELGISSLSLQWGMSHGALGASLSQAGINGFRHSSAWIAYGIRIAEGYSAGVGIHCWNSSIRENWFHHPGFSFAAGIQGWIREKIRWGIRLVHPVGWQSGLAGKHALPMKISTGACILFGQGTSLYLETVSVTGQALQWRAGLEWKAGQEFRFQFGMHPAPLTLSGGIVYCHHRWKIQTAFSFGPETGASPATAFTYVW